MRELDMLLLDYADQHYGAASAPQRDAFRRLLSLPDPEILNLLTGRSQPQDELLGKLIQQLLDRDS